MPDPAPHTSANLVSDVATTGSTARLSSLAADVHAGFSRKYRDRLAVEEIERILSSLDLSDTRASRPTPLLRLRRLRFVGEKLLRGADESCPISYDQALQPGVNVVHIEGNDVGKSSIMKTIKFALTGDDGDYDLDVKSWIRDVWLTFSLGSQVFTVVLSTRDGLRAAMVVGEEARLIEEVVTSSLILWEAAGGNAVKTELQRFFFYRLGLSELSWTFQTSQTASVTTASTTWLTYFQALQIVDDRYLLCDPAHSYGNQQGLILSSFLGLRMVEPLNRLGVEAQRIHKEHRAEQARTEEEMKQAEEEVARHGARIEELRAEIAAVDAVQHRRRDAVRASPPAIRLMEVETTLVMRATEHRQLLEEREDLGRHIRQARAEARRMREAVKLRLHFTGLTVNVCPNCDGDVDEAAVHREEVEHLCRLCARPPRSAPAEEVAIMEAQADAAEARAREMDRDRDALNARARALDGEINALTEEADLLRQAAERGVDAALPTPEEEAQRMRLAEEIGGLNAQIHSARRRTEVYTYDEEAVDLRVRVLAKARELLMEEAKHLNGDLLTWLSVITQDLVQRIGADSIGDVTILPLGDVQFTKNGVRIKFGSLHNPGDRLRVKLAFFLAMMRLGREPGLGRHPGVLLIDQPGGAEMVQEDCDELAEVFRAIDRDLANEAQVLCFTARHEFAAATEPPKVYGPQGEHGFAF